MNKLIKELFERYKFRLFGGFISPIILFLIIVSPIIKFISLIAQKTTAFLMIEIIYKYITNPIIALFILFILYFLFGWLVGWLVGSFRIKKIKKYLTIMIIIIIWIIICGLLLKNYKWEIMN